MEKYKLKPVYVEAEQFDISKPNAMKDVVYSHRGCGYRMCEICGGGEAFESHYYVRNNNYGYKTYQVTHGDWVIHTGDGNYDILPNKLFIQRYEKADSINY